MIASALPVGGALLLSVTIGLLVHELLHAAVLRMAGVECSLVFGPRSDGDGHFRTLVSGSVASVRLQSVPPTCSLGRLRLAAMAPLAMLLPIAAYGSLVTSGTLADTTLGAVAVVGWMACALPSPADFAIVRRPEETVRQLSGSSPAAASE